MDFQRFLQANLELNHENDQQMEVDEITRDFVCPVLYPDKHLFYEDI
jgi:hypothetical protein